MRFDLVDLRLFALVADAGSITGGAARAHLALASASERIRDMEAAAGAPLLERRHRGVVLTPAGRALLRHAREILDACERMRGELAQYGRGLKGHVRVMVNTSAIAEHLPDPLARFLASHPDVDVDLDEGVSFEIVEAVAASRADFGIASDQVDAGGLEARPFRKDALVLVATEGHPLAGRADIPFAETLDHDQVGLGAGGSLQEYLAEHARRLGRTIRLRARMRGFDAVCRLAAHGVGVAIVPASAARRARRLSELRVVPLSDGWASRTLVILTRPAAEPSPHAAALIAALLSREAG